MILKPNLEDSENAKFLDLPEFYYSLLGLSSNEIQRKNKMKNYVKCHFNANLQMDPEQTKTDLNFQLRVIFFHNNIANKNIENLEGGFNIFSENKKKNLQLRMKSLNLNLSPYDIEMTCKLIIDYSVLYSNYGKALFKNFAEEISKKKLIAENKLEPQGSENHRQIIECITFHVITFSWKQIKFFAR